MLKAIETTYRGYRFRSRLEARWAVCFDALAIKWEYEKEGFETDAGYYLPDFWLPAYGIWIEIKGKLPSDEELRKVQLLANEDASAILIAGTPGDETVYLWDGKQYLITDNNIPSFLVWCDMHCRTFRNADHVESFINVCPVIRRAYDTARAARFEHGEQPVVNPVFSIIRSRVKVR
jgi:hypothetical protein